MRKISYTLSALAGLGLMLATPAISARPWHGVNPGESTLKDVQKRFGTPHRALGKRGKCGQVFNYQGEHSIEGAKQANICFDTKGVVIEISVFPSRTLTKELVSEAYGSSFERKLTDEFREYHIYKGQGLAIFFDKEGKTVHSLLFTPQSSRPKSKPKTK